MDKEVLTKALFHTFNNIYVGEYSPEQQSYNICTFSEMLKNNRKHMKNNSFNGYIPISMGSEEDVRNELDKFEEEYGKPKLIKKGE